MFSRKTEPDILLQIGVKGASNYVEWCEQMKNTKVAAVEDTLLRNMLDSLFNNGTAYQPPRKTEETIQAEIIDMIGVGPLGPGRNATEEDRAAYQEARKAYRIRLNKMVDDLVGKTLTHQFGVMDKLRDQKNACWDFLRQSIEQDTWNKVSQMQRCRDASAAVPKDDTELFLLLRDVMGRGTVAMYHFSEKEKLNLKEEILLFRMGRLSFVDYNRTFDLKMKQAERGGFAYREGEQIELWVRGLNPDRYSAFLAERENENLRARYKASLRAPSATSGAGAASGPSSSSSPSGSAPGTAPADGETLQMVRDLAEQFVDPNRQSRELKLKSSVSVESVGAFVTLAEDCDSDGSDALRDALDSLDCEPGIKTVLAALINKRSSKSPPASREERLLWIRARNHHTAATQSTMVRSAAAPTSGLNARRRRRPRLTRSIRPWQMRTKLVLPGARRSLRIPPLL